MYTLPDDSPIRDQVLPAVWAGYKLPSIYPPEEIVDFSSQLLQQDLHLPKEVADKMSHTFWMGSVHDFYANYLDRGLTDKDHNNILQTANQFVKQGTIVKIDGNEKDVIKLLAAKVVLNAHQRANHAMSNACFLNEHGMLPKENVFMLQKGISPIFYEKDEFDRAEMLANDVRGVPGDRLLTSFTNWHNHFGMRYNFDQMGNLLAGMKYINGLLITVAGHTYLKKQRHPCRRARTRSTSRGWRIYDS